MDDQQTHYDILGLAQTATKDDIFEHYQLLSDQLTAEGVTPDDPRIVTLDDAYQILCDDVKRAEYDEQLKADKRIIDEPVSKETPPPRPKRVSTEIDPKRAEKIWQFKAQQKESLAQSKQKSKKVKGKSRASRSRFAVGCFLLTVFSCIGCSVLGFWANHLVMIEEKVDQLSALAENAYNYENYTQSIELLSEAIELDASADLYYSRGNSYLTRYNDQTDLLSAIVDFNHVLELQPEWTIVYKERGLAYYLMCQDSNLNCDLAIQDLAFYVENIDSLDRAVLSALSRLQEQQDDG